MAKIRGCELREKEVINIRDCKRLGYVVDLVIDTVSGEVCQIIIPGQGKLCGLFGSCKEYVIGWKCIKQIGPDIILVDVCMEDIIKDCDKANT